MIYIDMSRIQADFCQTSMISVHLRNFLIVKICNFIIIRFYFGFQKLFIVDRFSIKFFFNISAQLISNNVIPIFPICHHPQSKKITSI